MTDDQLPAQFGAMGQRIDKVAERLDGIEKQLAAIKSNVGEIRTILDIDKQIENLKSQLPEAPCSSVRVGTAGAELTGTLTGAETAAPPWRYLEPACATSTSAI